MAVCKLVYGSRELDLNDGTTFDLSDDFVPPATPYSVNFAMGTSANRTGGGTFISERANDKEFSFTVWVKGDSAAETHGSVRRLQNFINLAKDKSDKLYLEYNPSDAITFKPIWGQGNWLRFRVKYGAVEVGSLYGVGKFRAEQFPVLVSLVVAPYAEGIRQRVATAKGAVIEDWVGAEDGISRGLMVGS